MNDLPTGVGSNQALLAAGWKRRFLADPVRAEEAVQTYEGLGFEVRAEPLDPADVNEGCADCRQSICRAYVMIYTRRKRRGDRS